MVGKLGLPPLRLSGIQRAGVNHPSQPGDFHLELFTGLYCGAKRWRYSPETINALTMSAFSKLPPK